MFLEELLFVGNKFSVYLVRHCRGCKLQHTKLSRACIPAMWAEHTQQCRQHPHVKPKTFSLYCKIHVVTKTQQSNDSKEHQHGETTNPPTPIISLSCDIVCRKTNMPKPPELMPLSHVYMHLTNILKHGSCPWLGLACLEISKASKGWKGSRSRWLACSNKIKWNKINNSRRRLLAFVKIK